MWKIAIRRNWLKIPDTIPRIFAFQRPVQRDTFYKQRDNIATRSVHHKRFAYWKKSANADPATREYLDGSTYHFATVRYIYFIFREVLSWMYVDTRSRACIYTHLHGGPINRRSFRLRASWIARGHGLSSQVYLSCCSSNSFRTWLKSRR